MGSTGDGSYLGAWGPGGSFPSLSSAVSSSPSSSPSFPPIEQAFLLFEDAFAFVETFFAATVLVVVVFFVTPSEVVLEVTFVTLLMDAADFEDFSRIDIRVDTRVASAVDFL